MAYMFQFCSYNKLKKGKQQALGQVGFTDRWCLQGLEAQGWPGGAQQ
jgi:hypothetical protein